MNGGAAIYIYGTILVALVHVAIGASLGELASAYPNAGISPNPLTFSTTRFSY